jgi:hypothetical protein
MRLRRSALAGIAGAKRLARQPNATPLATANTPKALLHPDGLRPHRQEINTALEYRTKNS